MNKKSIKLWSKIFFMLLATFFSFIGIWSNIKAFSIVSLFFWIVILIVEIIYGIKSGKIKRL
jgi:hypothetical protein